MPTPTERLEVKRQIMQCKVCAWLSTLDDKNRREWAQAIANPRYSGPMVAAEIAVDGGDVSEGSVQNHRQKGHR